MASFGGNDKDNSLFTKIIKTIKEGISKSTREEEVAQIITKKKLAKECEAIAILHEAIEKQQIEVRKHDKPPTGFDSEGKEVERLRTKEEHEAKKKAEERLSKMHKAYEKAMESGDISDANNFIQQSGGKDKGNKEGEPS